MITMYLTRTGDQFDELYTPKGSTSQQHCTGKRGFLSVGQQRFFTIERGGRYVTLSEGEFECLMEDNSDKGHIFRVKAEGDKGHNVKNDQGKFARILIHSANYPHQVEGCIAPGLETCPTGVLHSKDALAKIFDECGGFVDGTTVLLVVKNPSADNKGS